MIVRCQIVHSDRGFEGVIVDESRETVYNTGFQPCPEDADGMMESVILRNGWDVLPWWGNR